MNLDLNPIKPMIDASNYGPWMLVERKCRQPPRMVKGNSGETSGPFHASKFQVWPIRVGSGRGSQRITYGPSMAVAPQGKVSLFGFRTSPTHWKGGASEVCMDRSIEIGLLQTELGDESPVTSLIRIREIKGSPLEQNSILPKETQTPHAPMKLGVEEQEGSRVDGHSSNTMMTEKSSKE
ncbi:hypothetical protein GOBAR_DD29589 [Gossypium barbadense]|nr:hypothetical protein GOBAR_DD29589 [Gossypium barbadense]